MPGASVLKSFENTTNRMKSLRFFPFEVEVASVNLDLMDRQSPHYPVALEQDQVEDRFLQLLSDHQIRQSEKTNLR